MKSTIIIPPQIIDYRCPHGCYVQLKRLRCMSGYIVAGECEHFVVLVDAIQQVRTAAALTRWPVCSAVIDRVSVFRDDEGEWWLEFYVDDIRYGVLVRDITRDLRKDKQANKAGDATCVEN